MALSLASILPIIYGIKELARNGWQPVPLAAIAVGLALGLVFVRTQRSLPDPLLDMRLFRSRAFTVALVSMLLNTMLPGGTMVIITQHLQLVEGLSPLQAGLWMLPAVAASVIGFQLSPRIARRVRPAYCIAAGLLVSVAGLVVLTQVGALRGLPALLTGFALFNLGAGPLVTLGTNLVISSVPSEKAGSAAAVAQTFNELGFALGIAVVGSIAVAIYHSQIGSAIPVSIPADAAAAARNTLADAVQAAGRLPDLLGSPLLATAREAFNSGLHAVAAISAVVLLGVAVLAAVTLRQARPIGQEEPAPRAQAPAGPTS